MVRFPEETYLPSSSTIVLVEAVFTDTLWVAGKAESHLFQRRSGIMHGYDKLNPQDETLCFSIEDVLTCSWANHEAGGLHWTISLSGTPATCVVPITLTEHRGIMPKASTGEELALAKGSWTMQMVYKGRGRTQKSGQRFWPCRATFTCSTHLGNQPLQDASIKFHSETMTITELEAMDENTKQTMVRLNPESYYAPQSHLARLQPVQMPYYNADALQAPLSQVPPPQGMPPCTLYSLYTPQSQDMGLMFDPNPLYNDPLSHIMPAAQHRDTGQAEATQGDDSLGLLSEIDLNMNHGYLNYPDPYSYLLDDA